jgi:DNA repair exonuclease SbcCD ATPase subunit
MTTELEQRVRAARSRADMDIGRAREVGRTGQLAEAAVARLLEETERCERTAKLFTTIGEQRQESAQHQFEEWVTRGLQAIFDEDLSFRLVQSVRGNNAQVDFLLRSVYDVPPDPERQTYGPVMVETPVMEARGGGMAVVVAFILRLVMLLQTPGARRVLFLDESFAHVSSGYEPRVAEFLKMVSENAGVQIVMITHSDAFSDLADVRYRLELEGGVTVVRQEG